MFKRIISCFLAFVITCLVYATPAAHAAWYNDAAYMYTQSGLAEWFASGVLVGGGGKVGSYLGGLAGTVAIPGYGTVSGATIGHYVGSAVGLGLKDAVDHFMADLAADSSFVSERDYIAALPPLLNVSSEGSTAAGIGYEMSGSGCDKEFWSTINLYYEASSASVGQFMLLGSYGSTTSFYGLTLQQSSSGARYLVYAIPDGLFPYSAISMPLGEFVSLSNEVTPCSVSDGRYPVYLSESDFL